MKITSKLIYAVVLGCLLFIQVNAQCAGCADKCETDTKAKITFLEFGSVTCIPCKQMQPIMKSIEAKYGEQIEVIFYDIKKEENESISKKYEIRLIPTQVFLNEKGEEIFRHEGFYPETEIVTFLEGKGLKAKKEIVKK